MIHVSCSEDICATLPLNSTIEGLKVEKSLLSPRNYKITLSLQDTVLCIYHITLNNNVLFSDEFNMPPPERLQMVESPVLGRMAKVSVLFRAKTTTN